LFKVCASVFYTGWLLILFDRHYQYQSYCRMQAFTSNIEQLTIIGSKWRNENSNKRVAYFIKMVFKS